MTGIPSHRVTHHRPDGIDFDRRLEGLGGPNGTGALWYHDIDTLIRGIESRSYRLWTVDMSGKSVWVEVHTRNHKKYLKTQTDGVEPNNLLALPRC